jgi:hypothetical protein
MQERKFETRQIEHPEKKVSKSTGEILKVTQYSDDNWNTVYESSDIITLGSGKTCKRFVKADLTDDEMEQIETAKGEATLRKICEEVASLAKRIENASKNSGIVMEQDKLVATNDFTRHQIATALEKLMGTEQKNKVALPF